MTTISHDGVSARGLRRSVVRPRIGARLVRPGSRDRNPSASRNGSATIDAAESISIAPGGAAVANAPTGLAGIPTMLGLRHLQFVLAGRRVRMGNGAFVVSVLLVLTAMLGALLFLNTALAENSFQLSNIRQNMRDMTVREQVLSSDLAAAESPVGLEQKARDLGMVPAGSPVFLRLSDGKILGEEAPATVPEALPVEEKPDIPVGGESPVGMTSSATAPSVEGGATGGSGTVSGQGESAATRGTSEQSNSGNSEQPLGIVSGANR